MKLSVAVLRNTDFRLLLFTRFFALFAVQAQAVIVGWQIYTLTHSTLMLGVVGLVEALPALVCALYAGHLVDISKPFRIYVGCLAALAVSIAFLWLAGGGLLNLSEQQLTYALLGGAFVSGLARSFIMPASSTLLARFVPRSQMSEASAWLSSAFQLAAIVGPAVAGLVYGGYGARVAWSLPLVCMVLAVACIGMSRHPDRHRRNSERREKASASIRAGWRFLLHNRTLLSIMALDMLAVLLGGAIAVLPAFATEVLGTGSEGLGLLRAAPAVGSIFTALYLALRPMRLIRGSLMLWVVAGFGVSIVCFGLSTSLYTAAFFLGLSGAFDSVSMVIRGTLSQLLTPDEMRGRVSSVNSMFIISSNEIGAFVSGALATLLGLVPSIVVGGIGTLAVVTATAGFSKKLRRTVVDTHA